jgi:hypothetical protein
MRFDKIVLLAALIAFSAAVSAQTQTEQPFGIGPGQTPAMEINLGYTYLHANAPPAQCGCFSLNGGFGSLAFNARHGVSIVADLSSAHASNISGTSQSITLFNYLFGPRCSLRSISHRFIPYGQVLVGGSKESSNYAYVQDANGFAFSVGGGLNTTLTRRIGWNVVEADWLHSQLSNDQNNRQNDLRISSAIIFRFGLH